MIRDNFSVDDTLYNVFSGLVGVPVLSVVILSGEHPQSVFRLP